MSLVTVILIVGLVVLSGLAATCALCIGRERLSREFESLDETLLEAFPYLLGIGLVLMFKGVVHEPSLRLSRSLNWDITEEIYALEGLFVAYVQDLTPDALVPVFSGFYMFGFAYLLLAPILLYLLTSTLRPLKELLVAYSLNYLVGITFYTLFVAYGPRLHISSHVEGSMYEVFPETQTLTGAVSANTNVFPSLHASLSVIVLLFAWQTRDRHPRWFAITSVVATSVVLSTMILGIHWLTDVVAGVALAVVCVLGAERVVTIIDGEEHSAPFDPDTDGPTSTRSDD
jgi:membrane-associated phospholipid phosphatase